jgi:chorismate-pyruvate lyase
MSYCASNESTPTVLPWAHPLDELYAKAGLSLPQIQTVPGDHVPQPYRKLLVHEGDMTPTLEKFHKSSIHLNVLGREQRNDFYYREVLLLADDSEKVVEFGAIKINLAYFPPQARQDILREHLPLGTILARYKVEHSSRPKAFLKVQSDAFMNGVLGLSGPHTLYGRRNTLSNLQGQSLAEIVEIIPPVPRRD